MTADVFPFDDGLANPNNHQALPFTYFMSVIKFYRLLFSDQFPQEHLRKVPCTLTGREEMRSFMSYGRLTSMPSPKQDLARLNGLEGPVILVFHVEEIDSLQPLFYPFDTSCDVGPLADLGLQTYRLRDLLSAKKVVSTFWISTLHYFEFDKENGLVATATVSSRFPLLKYYQELKDRGDDLIGTIEASTTANLTLDNIKVKGLVAPNICETWGIPMQRLLERVGSKNVKYYEAPAGASAQYFDGGSRERSWRELVKRIFSQQGYFTT